MSAPDRYQWRRDKDGLGVWEHRGKVAVAGVGHSPVDRRWDGVSMDKTLGAYSILACQKAMDEAGVTPDQIDGVICCDSHIAGGSGGSASQWAPRPYFAPPYDFGVGAHAGQRDSGSSSRWGCAMSNSRRPDCRRSAKWWAWRHRPWVTAFAAPVSSSTRQAISKAAIVAVARTPTTTPAAHANGRRPGAITAATISSTCSRTVSTAGNTAASTTTSPRSSSTSTATGCSRRGGSMPRTRCRSSPSRSTSVRATC